MTGQSALMRRMFALFSLALLCISAQDRVRTSVVPDNLRPPAAQKLLFQAHGVGDQIYTCKIAEGAYAWALKAPDAKLLAGDGKLFGQHFAGPTWKSKDGSGVLGKQSRVWRRPILVLFRGFYLVRLDTRVADG